MFAENALIFTNSISNILIFSDKPDISGNILLIKSSTTSMTF